MANVQVTTSPSETSIFEGDEPSEHVTSAAVHPPGVVCEIEYPEPGDTLSKVRVFGQRVRVVTVVVELERRRAEPAAGRVVEVLRVVGQRVLDDDDLRRACCS